MHNGRNDGLAWNGNLVSFGEYGLKATQTGQITARQIEAARRSISRYVKRGGKMWIRVFPDKPITKKPIEVRMGSGKGAVEFWVAQIQPGRMIYRSEEHTSELQSLMRISYAVFCLKKKKQLLEPHTQK